MARSSGSFADESGGAADEGPVTSSSDNHEGFTTLDSRGSIASITLVLVDSKRFTGDCGLIDLDECIFGDDTAVGRNNGTFFNLNDIARNDFRCFEFNKSTVSKCNRFEGKGFLQFFDN